MTIDLSTAEITGYWLSITNTEGQIDRALDSGDRRAFRVWCRRRASLAARLQHHLIRIATIGRA
jgi:hypothetical protein